MFAGVGGKLGTVAMVSTPMIATLLWPFKPYSYLNLSAWTSITPTLTIACTFTGGLGSLLTILLREKVVLRVYKFNDAVIGSTLGGLIGGFLLPQIPTIGHTLSLVFYEGSFAGMSSRKRLPKYVMFFIVGALSGVLFILLYGFFPGCGGKLGFIAFSSVLIFQCSKLRVREHDLFIFSLIVMLLSILIGVATGLYWIPICVILLGYLLLLTYLVKKRDLPTQEGGAQQTRLRRRDTTRWSSLIVRANRIRAL